MLWCARSAPQHRKLSLHFIWGNAVSTRVALFSSRATHTVNSSTGVWLRGRQLALFTYYRPSRHLASPKGRDLYRIKPFWNDPRRSAGKDRRRQLQQFPPYIPLALRCHAPYVCDSETRRVFSGSHVDHQRIVESDLAGLRHDRSSSFHPNLPPTHRKAPRAVAHVDASATAAARYGLPGSACVGQLSSRTAVAMRIATTVRTYRAGDSHPAVTFRICNSGQRRWCGAGWWRPGPGSGYSRTMRRYR
jgi:hypothetical protein